MSKEISELHLKIKRKSPMRKGIVVSLLKIKRKRQMRLNFSLLPQIIKRKSPYISHSEIIDITHL